MSSFELGSTTSVVKQRFEEAKAYDVPGPGLGPVNRATLVRDPKHLAFTLARYKFVSKMLHGHAEVLEVGCHEATGSLIVANNVHHLTAIDFQTDVINWCKSEYTGFVDNITFIACDAMSNIPDSHSTSGLYDAIYMLDVLEHIEPSQESKFLGNILKSLNNTGTFIVGIPSLESQQYASEVSKVQHVNCKTQHQLRKSMRQYFHNVYMFGMNDEVLHVGFSGMCHYIFALCTNGIQQ
jgi:2-polyprenyl-3-methyl-5-hydroxy-6-metoxy-1,4-benzoquinol methylase